MPPAAIGLLASRTDADKPTLLATYVSHTIIRGLMNGSVLAASFDDPIVQAQMAIRQVAAVRNDADQRLAPKVVLLTRDDASLGTVRISPAEYFPAVQ